LQEASHKETEGITIPACDGGGIVSSDSARKSDSGQKLNFSLVLNGLFFTRLWLAACCGMGACA
jgi:hypothetical protein